MASQERVFELFVDQLVGEAQLLDEVLLVRLRWFGEDIETVIRRLGEDPQSAVRLVNELSRLMQELDTAAGQADQSHAEVATARRWALLLPESTVNS